jgi:hypothetical protein
MNRTLTFIVLSSFIYPGCYQAAVKDRQVTTKTSFVYTETIVKGSDTGMIAFGTFRRSNIADILCQRWQMQNDDDIVASVTRDPEIGASDIEDVVLFKDSSVVLDPMGKIKLGRWQIWVQDNVKSLILSFPDQNEKQYIIENLSTKRLVLGMGKIRDLTFDLSARGMVHQNMYNDPFHPINNQWRIKPDSKETDSAIHMRLKNCLLFFSLYYRDHIKRKAETVSFEGLPRVFSWYNRGIGLPDKQGLDESFIECFYNEEQALKGYSILRKLIVDYEFHWHSGAPGWIYETHSVLEQMYHKLDELM